MLASPLEAPRAIMGSEQPTPWLATATPPGRARWSSSARHRADRIALTASFQQWSWISGLHRPGLEAGSARVGPNGGPRDRGTERCAPWLTGTAALQQRICTQRL